MAMSTQTELDLEKTIDGDEKAVCHLMPCRIDHNEVEIKAKEYFWITVRELNKGGDNDQGRKVKHHEETGDANQTKSERPILTASFRGRPLQGSCIKLPDGYSGHVLSKPLNGMQKLGTKNKVVAKHFDEITYWNWDELPEPGDAVNKAFDWINVSKALHDPI